MQIQNISAYERRDEDIFKIKERRKYNSFYGNGLMSPKLSSIYISRINFGLLIGSFVTIIKNNEYYLELSKDACTTKYFSSFTNFWYNNGNYETNIISSFFIFLILFISIQIFSIFIHTDVANLDIKGILYYVLITIDSVFLILFYIYLPLFLFLLAYSIIVLSTDPIKILNNSSSGNYANTTYLHIILIMIIIIIHQGLYYLLKTIGITIKQLL